MKTISMLFTFLLSIDHLPEGMKSGILQTNSEDEEMMIGH